MMVRFTLRECEQQGGLCAHFWFSPRAATAAASAARRRAVSARGCPPPTLLGLRHPNSPLFSQTDSRCLFYCAMGCGHKEEQNITCTRQKSLLLASTKRAVLPRGVVVERRHHIRRRRRAAASSRKAPAGRVQNKRMSERRGGRRGEDGGGIRPGRGGEKEGEGGGERGGVVHRPCCLRVRAVALASREARPAKGARAHTRGAKLVGF